MAGRFDVAQVSELIDDGVLGSNDGYGAKNAELGNVRLPFARAGNINGGFNFAGSHTRLLPVATTVICARGTVGRIALVGVPMAMNQSCYGLRGRLGARGFLNYFSTPEFVMCLQQRAHGSVFDTITRDTLAGVSVVEPRAELIKSFEKRVSPSLERIRTGLMESRTLAALRDTLLPKLISGELRIKDADRFVSEAV